MGVLILHCIYGNTETNAAFSLHEPKSVNTFTEEFATLDDTVLLHPFKLGFVWVGKVPWWGIVGQGTQNDKIP